MKKILAILLTLVLMVSVLPMGLFTITAGAVANDEYIEIYTAEDLDAVRFDVSGNYILMNDIDLSKTEEFKKWIPIGCDGVYCGIEEFSGVFVCVRPSFLDFIKKNCYNIL